VKKQKERKNRTVLFLDLTLLCFKRVQDPMAVSGRGSRGGSTLRGFFSYRIFISAMFSLLFIATLSVLFSTNPSTENDDSVSSSVFVFLL